MTCKHQNALEVWAKKEITRYEDCGETPCRRPSSCGKRYRETVIDDSGVVWCPDCGAIRMAGKQWALVGGRTKKKKKKKWIVLTANSY